MRKFYKVRNCQTGSSELVLANGHVDALSFYRKKNNVEKSVTLECSDFFVRNNDGGRFMITKLSELPDGATFHKALDAFGWCCYTTIHKVANMANGMVHCTTTEDGEVKDRYFKGSTKVTVEV